LSLKSVSTSGQLSTVSLPLTRRSTFLPSCCVFQFSRTRSSEAFYKGERKKSKGKEEKIRNSSEKKDGKSKEISREAAPGCRHRVWKWPPVQTGAARALASIRPAGVG